MSCNHKDKYHGERPPKRRCYGCWAPFFTANIGKTAAWIAILDMHGFEYLEGAKGTRFAKMLRRYSEELKNG